MGPKTAQKPANFAHTDRGEATRRQILDAAARSFAEHGFNGNSLNDIVRDSGLTKGAFYFHFPSKEALALAVFRDRQERWIGQTMAAVMEHPRAIDQLEAMLDIGCDIHENDDSARAISRLCQEWASQEDLAPHSRSHLTTWFDITTQLIVRAQEEGDVRREVDARVTAETICSAFIGIQEVSAAMSGLKDFRARIDGLRTVTLAAIRTPDKKR
jgi:AcrR family transcriptional regulator